MSTMTVPKNTRGQPFAVGQNEVLTLTGSPTILEYTLGSLADISNGVASWSTLSLSINKDVQINKAAFVRATTGATAVTLTAGAPDGSGQAPFVVDTQIGPVSSTSAEALGASASATAAVNTAAINLALSKGGLVTLNTPGTYLIDKSATVTRPVSGAKVASCLVIPSNTRFVVGAGVTLKVASGLINPCLISNANALSNGTDSNITIEGGTWDGNSDNVARSDVAGSEMPCIHIWMQGITNLTCRNMTITNPRSWGFGIANCNRVYTDNTRFIFTCAVTVNQGGFQIQGPNTNHIIRNTYGNTYDDLVAYDTFDTTLYTNTMAGFGPASDIIIDGVTSDPASGVLHHVRIQDAVNNAVSRCQIRNVSGPYWDGGVLLNGGNSGAAVLNGITVSDITVYPLPGKNPTLGRISINNGANDISIANVSCTYQDGAESTRRGCISFVGGTTRVCHISNLNIFDTTTAGANVSFIQANAGTATVGDLHINNVYAQTTLSGGSNSLVGTIGSGTIGRLFVSNAGTIRCANLLSVGGVTGITQGAYYSNVYSLNAQAPAFKTTAAIALANLKLSNVHLDGTNGGANGCINFGGLSGTCVIQMSACSFSNGANANIVRSASEAIRVQSLDVPVPSTVLTPTRGDCILDSTSNNDPFRWNGSAWTAL